LFIKTKDTFKKFKKKNKVFLKSQNTFKNFEEQIIFKNKLCVIVELTYRLNQDQKTLKTVKF